MDILIKGLALPKKGTTELTIYEDGHVLYEQDDGQFIEMGDGTAIELPPHGRLIDADIMKEAFEATALIEASRDKGNEQIYFDRIELVHGIIDRTPTVLEAST